MRRTQRELVLDLLDDGGWHSTIEFVDLGILRVPSRVWELRCEGHPIDCRRRPHGRGSKAIFEYRLLEPRVVLRPTSARLVICPTCRAPKHVKNISAGLAYLSCGLHHVHVDELEGGVA